MKNTFMFRGRVTRMGSEKVSRMLWLGIIKERGTSQDIGVDRRIILKWNFQSMGCRPRQDSFESV